MRSNGVCGVLLLVSLHRGKPSASSVRAIRAAKETALLLGTGYRVVALGDDLRCAAETLSQFGADIVYLVDGPGLDHGLAEQWAPALEDVLSRCKATVLMAASESIAVDVLPRVAGRLGAGMASDVTSVALDDHGLTYCRFMYAGTILSTVRIESKLQVVTIRAAAFAPAELQKETSPVEMHLAASPEKAFNQIQFLAMTPAPTSGLALTDASIVCAGGRGMGTAQKFALVEALADALHGAVAGTRAAVDFGLIGAERQVGQSGQNIAPDLYVAVGVSGALQHMAGVRLAKTIVAINKDADAPIFKVSDFGIVGDATALVPALIEALKDA